MGTLRGEDEGQGPKLKNPKRPSVRAEIQAPNPTAGRLLTKAYVGTKGSKSVSLGTKAGGSKDLNGRAPTASPMAKAKRRRK